MSDEITPGQARDIAGLLRDQHLLPPDDRAVEWLNNDFRDAVVAVVEAGAAALERCAELERQLAEALIKIAELPGPTPDTIPADQLTKIDRLTALQLGHAMGIMDACDWLRVARQQPGDATDAK